MEPRLTHSPPLQEEPRELAEGPEAPALILHALIELEGLQEIAEGAVEVPCLAGGLSQILQHPGARGPLARLAPDPCRPLKLPPGTSWVPTQQIELSEGP